VASSTVTRSSTELTDDVDETPLDDEDFNLDDEGDRTAETFTGGFDVGNGGAVNVGVGRRESGGTEGCTGHHHRAGRQGRQERPVN